MEKIYSVRGLNIRRQAWDARILTAEPSSSMNNVPSKSGHFLQILWTVVENVTVM